MDAAKAPHPVYVPTWLPKGFGLDRVEEVVQTSDAGGAGVQPLTIQRLIFTDGIARVDLIQHGLLSGSQSASNPRIGGANPLVVLLRRMGPLEIAHGLTDLSSFVIESRITGADFRTVLRSLSQIN